MCCRIIVSPVAEVRKEVIRVGEAAKRTVRLRVTGHVLVCLILLGLIYLVHWVITEEPRPNYPGIEKLRGQSIPDPSIEAVS